MVRFGRRFPQIGDYACRPVMLGDVILGVEWDNGDPDRRHIVWRRKLRVRWPAAAWQKTTRVA